ncbi:MAG: hypothetical protein Q4B72_14630 [Lachnospiraceae bacterium]|nr:hypothetical protein [Lachnospiraceae bacterium]
MKKTDMRFDSNLFKTFVGKIFNKYRCDEFVYTSSVTQIVGLYIGDEVFKMTNILESIDYYGVTEDIAVCKFNCCEESDIKSAFVEGHLTDTPVNGIINQIKMVNEHQQVFVNDTLEYDVWLTRGIIFFVNGREISFEKDIVPFSEELNIRKGYELIDSFGEKEDFTEGWDEDTRAQVEREVITIE